MAGRKKRRRREAQAEPVRPAEDRTADAVTVAWMLSMLATLVAQLASLAAWIGIRLLGPPEALPGPLRVLPALLLLTASVTGVLCLLLIPLTYKLRRSPPPPTVTAFAALVAVVPLATLVAISLRH